MLADRDLTPEPGHPVTLPCDQAAERAVLGALLLNADAGLALGVRARGLRAEHFYWSDHEHIYAAILALADTGHGIDVGTVAYQLERAGHDVARSAVDELPGYVPAGGHCFEHAERVIEMARWRDARDHGHRVVAATTAAEALSIAQVPPDMLATPPPRRLFRPVTEVRASSRETPEPLWDGYAYRGAVTLLAGRPKVGKTTLIRAIVEAVLSGQPLLGRRTTPASVLWATEDPSATVLAGLPDDDRLRILPREDAFPKPSLRDLAAEAIAAAKDGPVLLIPDSLAFWWDVADENDAAQVKSGVAPLLEAAAHGVTPLVPLHQRKGGGEGGEALRGSSALAAAADVIVEVERAGDDAPDTARRLVAVGRFPGIPPVVVVDRDLGAGDYRVLGNAGSRSESAAVAWRERLVRVLPDDRPGMTNDELEAALDARKRAWLGSLDELREAGSVTREGAGRKGSPFRYALAPGFRERIPSSPAHGTDGNVGSGVSDSVPSKPVRAEGRNGNDRHLESVPCAAQGAAWDNDTLAAALEAEFDAVDFGDRNGR